MFLDSVQWFVLTILSILVIIIFGGSLYAFFFSIIQFVFSSWDSEKIKKAWNSIRFMILGIFMTLIFLFIFPILFKKLEVPGYQAYTAQNIFSHATYLVRSIFLFGTEAVQNYQLPGTWDPISNPWLLADPSAGQPTQGSNNFGDGRQLEL